MNARDLIRRTAGTLVLAGALACLPMATVLAAEAGDGALRRQIVDFLRAKNPNAPGTLTVDVRMPRIYMSACVSPRPFLPGQGTRTTGRLTVGVRCPGQRPATRYVTADVHVDAYYYVAAHDIRTGQTVRDRDIRPTEGDITRMSAGVVTRPDKLIGQVAVRRIASAMPIRTDMVAAPKLIARGDWVTVVARGPGFSITTHGKALNSAPSGGEVRVHTDGGSIVTGTPRDAHTVLIGR